MKDKLTRNISLKILSIILAAIIWLVITNVDDPVVPMEFNDVPVEILNEEEVTNLNPAYDIIEGEIVDFKIKARRSIRDRLTEGDFNVTADFAHLSDTNAVPIKISCRKELDDDVVFTSVDNNSMKIRFEELIEDKFAVEIEQNGEVLEGYFVKEKTASPNIIYIKGPKSKIEQIDKVVVKVDVDGVTRPINRTVRVRAVDEEGNDIDSSKLTFSETNISVSLDLYKTKNVPIHINIKGEPAKGYVMTDIVYQPESVTIAGSDEALINQRYLPIDIDIEGVTEDIEIQKDIELPPGVFLEDDDVAIAISITIEKMQTTELSIWPRDIEIKNKAKYVNVDIMTTGPIKIKVMGPEADTTDLTRGKLKAYIDLVGYTSPGTYPIALKSGISDNVEIYDTSQLLVEITR